MHKALTPDTRRLCEMLTEDGGWWTAYTLARQWRNHFAPWEVQHAIDALEAGGYIDSRDQAGTRIYAVTSSCKPLPQQQPGSAL